MTEIKDNPPPLPEPFINLDNTPGAKLAWGAQMREYGEACRNQALEEAAQKCDDLWQYDGTAYDCREAIRSLIK